jgi:hypothetical protein
MMPTLAGVNVPEKLLALVSRYGLQSDAVWATLVQVTILDAVSRSLAYYPEFLGIGYFARCLKYNYNLQKDELMDLILEKCEKGV